MSKKPRSRKNPPKLKKMRRLWCVKLMPYASDTLRSTAATDANAATWVQHVAAHNVQSAIGDAIRTVVAQSTAIGEPRISPFVVSVVSLGTYDADCL